MALTVLVRGAPPGRDAAAGAAPDALLSLTLDAPRIVLGRGDSCEVRLPDLTVSHRHASVRQKGGEYVVVDEGSQNGTWLEGVKLPPHTPRVLRSGELVRLGRVWLELRVEPAVASRSPAAGAKQLALELVARSLLADGEEPGPRITVSDGPDRGAALVLAEAGRTYAIGRSRECDLVLTDPDTSRRHVTLERRADVVVVRDLGSSRPATIDGHAVAGEAALRPGQELVVAGSRLFLDHAAVEALAEIERSPDERMREGETAPRPAVAASEVAVAPAGAALDATPTPAPAGPGAGGRMERAGAGQGADRQSGGWGALDGAVILLALGVLAMSAIGAWLLLGR